MTSLAPIFSEFPSSLAEQSRRSGILMIVYSATVGIAKKYTPQLGNSREVLSDSDIKLYFLTL